VALLLIQVLRYGRRLKRNRIWEVNWIQSPKVREFESELMRSLLRRRTFLQQLFISATNTPTCCLTLLRERTFASPFATSSNTQKISPFPYSIRLQVSNEIGGSDSWLTVRKVFIKLTMSRRTRANAKGGEEPARQLEDCAFNIFGWGIKIPTDKDGVVMTTRIINAYEASTTPYAKAIDAMEKKGESPLRESLSFTHRELDANEEPGIDQYMLVGFTLRGLEDDHFKMHASQKKQVPVGTHLAVDSIIEYKDLPLLVVIKMQESEQTKVELKVLLRSKLGLCRPYHVGQKECFYLPIFRDQTTDKKQRGPAWNQLVAKQAWRPSIQEVSSKQDTFKRARNTTKIVLEPKLSLQNEICSLVECFQKSGDMWHLKELEAVLLRAEEDLVFTPPAANTIMKKFIENEESFDDGDPALMVDELRQLWPELEIDATDLTTLKEQLVREKIILEYRLIKPFLAEACFQIRKLQKANDGLLDVAGEALATIRRVLGSCESAVPILTPDNESLLVPSIVSTLKNMLEAAKAFDKNLKDNCGDQTMTGTLHDVWEKYADALDTDAAKKAWFEAARYLTAAAKHKQRGLAEIIEDMVEVLDEMKLGDGAAKSIG
jgi:hypothetical protein